MTTTTSATSATTATTAATTTSSTTNNIGQSILTSLGAGTGVDTASLISSLVTAQFAAKNASLSAQDTALNAQISSVAKIQSAITSFSSALTSLVKGGTLTTKPTSTDSTILTAVALPGAKLSGLSAQVEVDSLATAQTATSATSYSSPTATVGTGNLTLTFGTATVANGAMSAFTAGSAAAITIPIDSDHQTLAGIASAINAKNAGVTATIVTDADGTAKLTLKGATGSAQAFTLSSDTPGDALSALDIGVGATGTAINSSAANAQLKLDGVAVQRASNTINDLVTGVKLSLTGASVGKPVTLGSTTPSDAMIQAVNDFVTTYNQVLAEVQTETDPATGSLRGDYNATNLLRSLRGLTTTVLTTGGVTGAPNTLAAIGVATAKDGTLSVNSTTLSNALINSPDAVEAMLADGTGATGAGLGAALSSIVTTATDNKVYINGSVEETGLSGSTALYTAKLSKVSDEEAQVVTDTAAYQQRLTTQYAASDARVAAYKAAQTALQNQIDQWNKTSS
jgi:flagellar hook-associated protein 2